MFVLGYLLKIMIVRIIATFKESRGLMKVKMVVKLVVTLWRCNTRRLVMVGDLLKSPLIVLAVRNKGLVAKEFIRMIRATPE